MDDIKEEIKARLSVEDVVGQYIELKRSGRTLKGHSPWGVDKTPSFMVSPEKGIWHDFSAGKGGDIFTFLMEVEGIPFREALEKLAAQAGVELKKYSTSDRENTLKKARAREALELATKYYQVALSKNREICEYVFYKRRMNKATVREFRIGYAPQQGKALKAALMKRGFSEQDLNTAGLLTQYGGDLFRGRMMIPFIDTGGTVIGYTARVIKDGEPKYLNTPDTLLFNKSRFCFGLYNAKPAIRELNYLVIVEGNMDVISSHQAGVKTAVATSGTAMTEQHLKILSRLTKDIRLAYDGDAAGINATERAINLAGALGINLSVISDYHGAKDPDELIQKDPALWQDAVNHPRPAVDYLLDKYEERLNLNTGQGKREYSDLALKLLSYLKDPVEKKHYQQQVAKRLDVSLDDLLEKKLTVKPKRLKQIKNAGQGSASPLAKTVKTLEDSLLAIMLYGGEAGTKIHLELPEDDTKIDELSLIYDNRYASWDAETLQKEAEALLKRYNAAVKKQQIAELTRELSETEDEEASADILRKIQALQNAP